MNRPNSSPALPRILGACMLLSAASVAVGQDSAQEAEALAERLVQLRSQVEELNQELEIVKEEHRAEMQGLAAQKAELEANRNRLETQVRQLEQTLEENRAAAAEAGVDNERLEPVLMEAIAGLRAQIEVALPFKRDERLAELDEIRVQLESDVIPANRAANRLWAFHEDEIRLTRENGIYNQTIELGGERLLADVAKLGTVMMFFRTSDLRYGQVKRQGADWQFVTIDDAAQIAAIEGLFDSLQKQIRQGFFELPNTLSGMEVSS